MTMRQLMSVHRVYKLTEAQTRGAGLGSVRTRTRDGSALECRVVPLSSREVAAFSKEGLNYSHAVFFWFDPKLDEESMLEYTDSRSRTRYLVVKGVSNPDELDRFWRIDCEEHTGADNT